VNEFDVLRALKARVPFRTAKRLLVGNQYPVAKGWDEIFERTQSDAGRRRNQDGLAQAYRESLIASEKSLHAYSLSPEDIQALRDAAMDHVFDASDPFVENYPLPVGGGELATAGLMQPKAVGYERVLGATTVVFSSVRELEFREQLGVADLAQNTALRYEKVYGLRTERRQAFDVLLVPDRGPYVYVLADNPGQTNAEVRALAHFTVRMGVNALVGRTLLNRPVNLFSLISTFYNSSEGAVNLLSYSTTTSSVKTEKMRGSGKCLREELFHKTGMRALGHQFRAFEIGVEWQLPEVEDRYTPHPVLKIHGSYRMTYDHAPVVDEALVHDCGKFEELDHVLERISFYLPPPE
jgi:hypothetical protein